MLNPNKFTYIDYDCQQVKATQVAGIINSLELYTPIPIHISFSHNHLKIQGAEIIAEILKQNPNIRFLDLSFNQIKNEGATAIAEALKQNTNLKVLYLNSNDIRLAGIQNIGEMLRLNKSLISLDVSNNKIKKRGAQDLAYALTLNKSLTSFGISNNPINSEGVIAIYKALKRSKEIINIRFEFCEIDIENKEKEIILGALNANTSILYTNCPTLHQRNIDSINLRNREKFQQDYKKILDNQYLSFQEYYQVFCQLAFFINHKQIFDNDWEIVKEIDIQKVKEIIHDKIFHNLFSIKGVCKTKDPHLPYETWWQVFSYLTVYNITSHPAPSPIVKMGSAQLENHSGVVQREEQKTYLV